MFLRSAEIELKNYPKIPFKSHHRNLLNMWTQFKS